MRAPADLARPITTRVCSGKDILPAADRRTIGGPLGVAQYAVLANLHRPSDPAALAAEIARLNRGGLKPLDISVALRVALPTVLEALGRSAIPTDYPPTTPEIP
jgi:hypothetical protein